MAVTLAESAVLSQDQLARGVMETFIINSPVFDRVPFMTIEGNSYAYDLEGALPGVAFRSVNEAYTESTGTFLQRSENLVILGGDADVDRFIQQTRSNLNDQRARQTTAKVKALTYKFQDAFINGDVTVEPKGFDGLRKRVVGTQVIDAATNGMGVIGGGNDFFDRLDQLVAAVDGGADVLYCNAGVRAAILSAGRRLGGASVVVSDLTGKREATWHGVPVLDLGTRPDGSPIIPQNETQGTSTAASSIYAVKFGQDESDRGITGLTNGGVMVEDLGQLQEKPAWRTRIEWYLGLASFGPRAAARLKGVTLAT